MAAGHGGARPGSGRKPSAKNRDAASTTKPTTQYPDPLTYLIAVATGEAPGDGLRVAAAKAALPYTQPKARAPVASPPPAKLRNTAERAGAAAEAEDWAQRAAAVRRRHAAPKGTP